MYGTTKRKVFISYHHRGDQNWFDEFTRRYDDQYDVFYDNSLDGRIRSDDPEYVNRTIREEHIVGSSITIVLCGAETWKRKYVDWEIHSTLHHEHALLGIATPTATRNQNGIIVPERLLDNIQTGYAHWSGGWIADPQTIQSAIEAAIQKSQARSQIRNGREKMGRNLS